VSESVWPGVANAIYDAIGVRLRQLPFTPQRALAGLADPRGFGGPASSCALTLRVNFLST